MVLDKWDILVVRMFMMDFFKVFDNVKYNFLVEKLKYSLFDLFIVNWYVNFFEDRK